MPQNREERVSYKVHFRICTPVLMTRFLSELLGILSRIPSTAVRPLAVYL
jgi:hypothetical protein